MQQLEAGDTGVDIATLGAGTSAKQLGKALLGYGINVGAEGGQEGLQQSVSIANRRRALEGETGLWNLTKGSAKVLWDSLTGKDSEAAGQMKEAGKEGMKAAAVLGGVTRVATLPFASTTNTVFSSAPILTENEIPVMQKQLADMQFQKRLDDLAAVYEKNVGNGSKFSGENTYADWLHSIGADGTELNTLEKYNKAKYNDSPEYQLLSGYSKAVEKGDISPLVGFAEYENTNKLLQESVVGLKTVSDVEIESVTTHFIDRVIGQTSTAHSNMRCGVEIADVIDTLQSPIKSGSIRVMEDGDIRQTLYGKSASITISVRDKRLIQVNPRRRTTE